MRLTRSASASVLVALVATGLVAGAGPAGATTGQWRNCSTVHRHFPHGVGRSGAHDRVRGHSRPVTTFTVSTARYRAAVRANPRLDADHDGIACEAR